MGMSFQGVVARLVVAAGIVAPLVTGGVAEGKGKRAGWFVQPVLPPAQAVEVARGSLSQAQAGPGWLKTGKRGEVRLEVPLVAGSQVIGRIGVHPSTGEILPKGAPGLWGAWTHSGAPGRAVIPAPISPGQATDTVARALADFTVGPGTWLAKHGEAWHVPLFFRGLMVGDLRVDSRAGALVPDWKAARDSMAFGRWAPSGSTVPTPRP